MPKRNNPLWYAQLQDWLAGRQPKPRGISTTSTGNRRVSVTAKGPSPTDLPWQQQTRTKILRPGPARAEEVTPSQSTGWSEDDAARSQAQYDEDWRSYVGNMSTFEIARRYAEKMQPTVQNRPGKRGGVETPEAMQRRINRMSNNLADAPEDVIESILQDDPTTLSALAEQEVGVDTPWRKYH